jgi:hypothetical protein
VEDTSNPPWPVSIGAEDLMVGTAATPITIHNVYQSPPCALASSSVTFNSLTAQTTSTTAGIQTIHISGTATNGVTPTSGTLHAETEGLLGVDY